VESDVGDKVSRRGRVELDREGASRFQRSDLTANGGVERRGRGSGW
jgi:hypothetical protein